MSYDYTLCDYLLKELNSRSQLDILLDESFSFIFRTLNKL
jgi:hypothetical protein